MNNYELNTKQIILDAAEEVFLEKGYGNAKTMTIAKRAGVSHSMLHYYFSTKENLFQTVFLQKIQMIASAFENIYEQHLPFQKTVRLIVESQFDFVAKNPQLPHFILNEILSNKENRELLFNALIPKVEGAASKLSEMLATEFAKGKIRQISMFDFLINIVAINISTFVVLPIMKDMSVVSSDKDLEHMLNARCESNVQFVLNALRP